jgi:hypothetical protein
MSCHRRYSQWIRSLPHVPAHAHAHQKASNARFQIHIDLVLADPDLTRTDVQRLSFGSGSFFGFPGHRSLASTDVLCRLLGPHNLDPDDAPTDVQCCASDQNPHEYRTFWLYWIRISRLQTCSTVFWIPRSLGSEPAYISPDPDKGKGHNFTVDWSTPEKCLKKENRTVLNN